MSIELLTFDIFGTVLDWRRGLAALSDAQFDRAVDRQGALEGGQGALEGGRALELGRFRSYAEIVAQSLVEVAPIDAVTAARLGAEAGNWPLFPDSADALRRLRAKAPCAAITNSDADHGQQARAQLGFELDGWICAGEVRAYKPDRRMWDAASQRMKVPFSRDWWHVSAYADYDHETARKLGLTCVFVRRPHSRPGPCDLSVSDLAELAQRIEDGAVT
jgi:2-haloalkanoic acid dehalogenase type II